MSQGSNKREVERRRRGRRRRWRRKKVGSFEKRLAFRNKMK